jgi:hypothetical protein
MFQWRGKQGGFWVELGREAQIEIRERGFKVC